MASGTWKELIPPPRTNLVTCKQVFDIKHTSTKINRFKARLVARGFTQKYSVNYTKTFAPTIRMNILRIFFALVVKEDLYYKAIDIKNVTT